MTQMILHKIDLKLFDVWLKGTFYTCYTTVSKAYKTYMYIYRTVGATSKKLRNGNVMNWARFPRQLLVCMKELYTPLIMVCLGINELVKKTRACLHPITHNCLHNLFNPEQTSMQFLALLWINVNFRSKRTFLLGTAIFFRPKAVF